jgi:hypothetical protein
LGVETVPGTAVAGDKKLFSIGFDADPNIPTTMVRPQGQKPSSDVIPQKEFTEGSYKGALSYTDLMYFLGGILETGTMSTPTTNNVWKIDFTGVASGTFTLTYNGVTSANITYSSTQSALITATQAGLDAMTSVGTGNFVVGSASSTAITITAQPGFARGLALTGSFGSLTGGTPTITTTAATNTRQWLYKPKATDPDTINTYTFEKGSSLFAGKFPFGLITDMQWDLTKSATDLSGKVMGAQYTDGGSMTSSPTAIPLVVASPRDVSIYLSGDDLSYTKLTRCLEFHLTIGSRFTGLYPLDASQNSYAAYVETVPSIKAQLIVEQDSNGNQMMTDFRNRTKKYLCVQLVGGVIETGFNYKLEAKIPFKFAGNKRQDSDGVYAGVFDLEAIYDAGLDTYLQVKLFNQQTAY